MDGDDDPVGDVLSRRKAIRLAGAPAVAWLAGCGSTGSSNTTGTGTDSPDTSTREQESSRPSTTATDASTATPTDTMTETPPPTETETPIPTTTAGPPGNTACVVRPTTTAGPFYSTGEDNPKRSDLRTDRETETRKEGVRLDLTVQVSEIGSSECSPIEGAQVHVWHADAHGVYSDVADAGTEGQDFLRAHHPTDGSGQADFVTIYPGWYPGRTPHVHFKVLVPTDGDSVREFTSQLFFTDQRSTEVYNVHAPYTSRDRRDTTNSEDSIFYGTDGALTLDLVEDDEGYDATFRVGMYVE